MSRGTGPGHRARALAQRPRQVRHTEVGRFNMFSRTRTNPGPERPLEKELFRPLARTAFYTLRSAAPRIRARMPTSIPQDGNAPIFIIGCGRSGTTLLGELFAKHPEISYLYEPYNLWAAVDPITDFLQLYSHGEYRCLLDGSSATERAQVRFRRLMSVPNGLTLTEKSPVNALRIDYLESIAPKARYVHIVRDGVDVARSIEKLASNTKKMAFRPPLNEWWGVGDAKWVALELDGQKAGYYPEETAQLTTDSQRGAYEWLMSLHEVEARRTRLGSRFVELRYQDLTEYPEQTLRTTMESLGLTCPSSWLREAAAQVSPGRGGRHGKPLMLPSGMCTDFNRLQEKFQFSGRALSISDQGDRHAKG
jgi:hypothetical protein